MTQTRMNTGSNTALKRRRVLVDPAVQWKWALSIAAVVFVCSSLISFGVFGELHEQARLREMHPGEYVGRVGWILMSFALGSAAVTAGGVGLWSLLMTRRMCGPAFVIGRYLNELKSGRIPKTRPLRKNDEFKRLYRTLGEAFDALRAKADADLTLVCNALESIRASTNAGDAAREKCLAMLASNLEKLRVDLVAQLEANDPKQLPLMQHSAAVVSSPSDTG